MDLGHALKKRINDLLGKPSRSLTERCPRGYTSWPIFGCTDRDCAWRVNSSAYKNCSFLAAQVRDHTLTEIGDMMGISRERVRQIEVIAIRKLRASFRMKEIVNVLHKQSMVKWSGPNSS